MAKNLKLMIQLAWLSSVLTLAGVLYHLDELLVTPKKSIASVKKIRGKVDVRSEDDVVWTRASVGTLLGNNDLIATGEKSSAEVLLNDGRAIQLGSNSQISLTAEKSKTNGESNVINLVRGQVTATKPIEKKQSFFTSTPKSVPLVIATGKDAVYKLDDVSSSIGINKDIEAGIIGVDSVTGNVLATTKEGEVKLDSKVVAVEDVVTKQTSDSNIEQDKTTDLSLTSLPPAFTTEAAKNPAPPVKKEEKSVVDLSLALSAKKLSIPKPKKPKFSPPPVVPLPAPKEEAPVIEPTPLPIVEEKEPEPPPVPAPTFVVDGAIKYGIFTSFKDQSSLPTIPIQLTWLGGESPSVNENASTVIQMVPRLKGGFGKPLTIIERLIVGRQEINIDVSTLAKDAIFAPNGFAKLLLYAKPWVKSEGEIESRSVESTDKKIELCSFADLKEQSYRVYIDAIKVDAQMNQGWFPWRSPAKNGKYLMSVPDLKMLNKLRPMLSQSGAFKIEADGMELSKRSMYFLNRGQVQIGIRGASPKESEIEYLKLLYNADLIYIGEGDSYRALDESLQAKSNAISRALKIQPKIYLLNKGNILAISNEDMATNPALIRSYLQTTVGYFVKEPQLLK